MSVDGAQRLSHLEPLTTLERKLDPRHAALVVVDMQNDYIAPGGVMENEGLDPAAMREMAARLPALIDAARGAGALVVFVRSVYSTEDNQYLSDSWLEQAARRREGSYTERTVCAAGSWGGELYGEIAPRPGEPIVTKHRFSAFHNTDLDTVLRSHGVRTVVLTGVATNVCVETAARDAFVRDYYVVFASDGTAAYSRDEHEASLDVVDKYFGQVATLDELGSIWAPASAPATP